MGKKILHLSAIDYGGAGNIATVYHNFYKRKGYQSTFIVQDKKDSDSGSKKYQRTVPHKIIKRGYKLSTPKLNFNHDYLFHNEFEKLTTTSAKKILSLCDYVPEVIFLYWISGFINAKVIAELQALTGAKIYWLMVDNAPVTGGCHYPNDCTKFHQNCSSCPAIITPSRQELAANILSYKMDHLPKDITLITYSKTDFIRAEKSILFKHKTILKSLMVIDEDRFKPADKTEAKKFFNIPTNKDVLFFGAANFNDKRKGLSFLIEAIDSINLDNIVLLVAGDPTLVKPYLKNKPIIYTGTLDTEGLIKAYQAAKLFLCPSIEDSGPMMINQSIMCGTPVISFDTGVATDLITNGITGYRAQLKNTADFTFGINSILSNTEYDQLSKNCRELGLTTFSYSKLSEFMISLIKQTN